MQPCERFGELVRDCTGNHEDEGGAGRVYTPQTVIEEEFLDLLARTEPRNGKDWHRSA